ncbi:DUF3825 domain-containing protein [bacterium]|nr:MAG: DUF3825 domain-containing protein [bacterium]
MTSLQLPKIFEFAYFPKYDEAIKYLAETLSDREPWDFSDSRENKHAILRNYLEYYYRRLKDEAKIKFTANNEYASFNTGLVTANQEEIFCLFERYQGKVPNSAPYYFKGFVKVSDARLLAGFGSDIPEPANFFEKPDLLILNPKYKIVPDIEHIINDNKDRFPLHLQRADDSEMRRQLHGAIEDVTKKVRTNYKIAIPQYFGSKIQLLLPLCLTSGSPNPDLALVIDKISGQDIYSAKTCLTLKMAYNNARLIVKPQSDWLRP